MEQDLPENQSPRCFRSGKVVASAATTPSKKLMLPFFLKIGKLY
jgi:hypothetical protein